VIRVARPVRKAPTDWTPKAAAERRAVLEAYRKARKAYLARKKKAKGKKPPPFTFSFEFKVYGDGALRDALNRFYGFKCAYCETYFGASQPVAVEHWRPKGEVIDEGKRIKPAYYWLAADWENLLPSCTDCNSPRRQITEADGKKIVRGKGNHFPLERGSRRARSPGKERNERPLLLNPERDDPERHLEFLTDDRNAGVIRAALVGRKPSPKGLASIEVYALDRFGLLTGRKTHALRLLSHLRNTIDSCHDHRRKPRDADLKHRYQRNLADLKQLFLDPANPYVAMVRQIVRARLPGVSV